MELKSGVTFFLDWLRVSVNTDTPNCDILPPSPAFEPSGEIITPLPNYTSAQALVCGRIDWDDDNHQQRKLVTLTGDDLLRARRMGVQDTLLLRWLDALETELTVTRLDVAFDTRNAAITPAKIYNAWGSGALTTKARTIRRVQGKTDTQHGAGYTVYIGSRQSEQFLRVYDKNAEQAARGKEIDLPDELWTRAELELKGGKARRALTALGKEGMSLGGELIAQFCDWPDNTVWQDIRTGNTQVDLSVGRKETDFETWCRRVVFPNMEKAVHLGVPGARELAQKLANDNRTL